MFKPESCWINEILFYQQEDILKLLGIKVKTNQISRLYCDGDNKVRIEIWTEKPKC